MENIKIRKVTPLQNLVLLIEFNNDIHKKYNVDLLFNQFPEYRILEHNPLFDTLYMWTVEVILLLGHLILTFPNGNFGIMV